MKKIINVLLKILLVLVVISSILFLWQGKNLLSLINGMKYSPEELASQLDSKREELKTKVEEYTSSSINDLSAEDEEKLFKGEITFEELSEKYHLPLNVMKEDNSQLSDADANIDSTPTTNNSNEVDKAISVGVSNMYALKAKYVSKLGGLERIVLDEYSKLPIEKQNASSKKQIVTKNLNYVADMEQQCDNEVEKVLSTLEKELKELNGDTEIVKILKEAYSNEKELKKSYYLSLYNN